MIWRRYITKEAFKVFALFLIGCYFVYVLLEYSMHIQNFHKGITPPLKEALLYYGYQFIGKLDLLVPLAMLISAIKVLYSLSKNHELLSLQVGGISTSRILRPFLLLAMLSSVLIGMSHEWLIPTSLNKIAHFEMTYFKSQRAKKADHPLNVISLGEESRLAYQRHDKNEARLFDVFWVPSPKELYRIKWLYIGGKTPIGNMVDHLIQNASGRFEKIASYDTLPFQDIELAKKCSVVPYEHRPISKLFTLKENPTALTHLLFKLSLTLVPFLIIIGIAPPCIRFSRNAPIYLIFGLGSLTFIAFYTIMNASLVLGENNVISPYIAILSLPVVLFFALGTPYWRSCR